MMMILVIMMIFLWSRRWFLSIAMIIFVNEDDYHDDRGGKNMKKRKTSGADSVEHWSLQRSGENGIFCLQTISNISYSSNTKKIKHIQIFSQKQNHNLIFANYSKYSQQFKNKHIQHFCHKKYHEKCKGMNFLQVKQFMLARKLFVGRITKELLQLMDVSIF